MAAALLLMLCAALFGLLRQQQALTLYHEDVARHMGNERVTGLLLQQFKVQAQEWKNVLLRGHTPQDRARYWQAFEKQERDIQAHSQQLLSSLEAGTARTLVQQFQQSHQNMGQAYREGLRQFENNGYDPRAGDAHVRGIDREASTLLEQAAQQIASDSAALSAQAQHMAEQARWLSLGICLLVFAAGLAVSVGYSRRITRPLAQAVAAAKEIKQLIALSGERVDAGVRQAGETGSTMTEIEQTIHRVTSLVQEIAQASHAQSTGVTEIGSALADIDNSTQHNAALVEEMTAATQSLHTQSQDLLRSASAFQTNS